MKFSRRIEADITRAKIATETDTFEVYNSIQINAKSTTKREAELKCDPIPFTETENLDLAFAHDKVWVNKIEYVASGDASNENIDNTIFYNYSRSIIEAIYEVYEQVAASGGEPTTQSDNYYSPDGVKFYSPDGVKLYKPY